MRFFFVRGTKGFPQSCQLDTSETTVIIQWMINRIVSQLHGRNPVRVG